MKSYGILSSRYLKQQRRRSVLTVLGIVLSVALISALLTMGQALKDNVLSEQIYENGSFHFAYMKPDAALYDKLKNNAMVDRVGIEGTSGETRLNDNYKVFTKELDSAAFELLPVHLSSGRLPASADEVVVEEWAAPRLPGKPDLGASVSLNGPDGKPHDYQLVGLLKNDKSSQMNRSAKAFTLMPSPAAVLNGETHFSLYVTLKKGVDISDQLPAFANLAAPNTFGSNDRVLALMGESGSDNLNRALVIVFGTLVGLVVLSTVAVIYNAFHISVLERIRQFGLLRTIGATPRQIRNLVLKEATTLAAFGIPIGLAIGWGALWLVLWLMIQSGFQIMQMEQFRLTFHWWIMGLSVGVGIFAVYLAAWLPARKASKVSPVDAVKGAGSIVRESYRRRRIPSLLHLLGVEGKMASNNIRRNRSKFRITTFSVIVSVMLFIVFHYFTQEMFKMTVDTTENNKIAFELNRYLSGAVDENGKRKESDVQDIVSPGVMEQIRNLPGVEDVYGRYALPDPAAIVPDETVNPAFSEVSGIQWEKATADGVQGNAVSVNLQLYDEARLAKAAKFLTSGTVDPGTLAEEDAVVIVQTVKPYNKEERKREIIPLTRYKVGDRIALQFGNDLNDDKSVRQLKVAGILSQSPFDSAYMADSLTVIGTKPTIAKLIEAAPLERRPLGTTLMGVAVALEDGADSEPARIALEQIAADIPGGQLINIVDRQKEERQFAVQMKIFVYGFLIVIGLIGSLNIINTVQTNLLLRRREFGLLQAVGMTMGQIRKMATAEGVWYGVIGSFWGLLLGIGFSYFLFVQLSGIQGMPFAFPWGGAVIACAFALAVGLFSVQGPLRRMSKANLIDELRDDA